MKIYLDTESAGLKGKLHTIQYSFDRDPVKILRCSRASVDDYMELLTELDDPDNILVGFNLGFDLWKLYQHFRPQEPFLCQVLDLYQHTLKSKPLCYYPLVGGKAVVKLNRIPLDYADTITDMICRKISSVLPDIAKIRVTRSAESAVEGETIPLCSLSFTVRIPAKLKELARLFLPEEEKSSILKFDEVLKLPKDFIYLDEEGNQNTGFTEDTRFPYVRPEEKHLYKGLWRLNEIILDSPKGKKALTYMRHDVEYLWKLEDWLTKQGNTIEVDDDDICTHVVAYTKYFGFPVDVPAAKELSSRFTKEMEGLSKSLGIDLESPKARLELLKKHADVPAAITSTSAKNLEILVEEDTGFLTEAGVEIARQMAKYKPLAQRRKQLEVITESNGRVYPDFVVLGTTTHRMRGTGGLNFQGVSREGDIRGLFLTSMGGDFDGLEWVIAANVYQDEEMLSGLANGTDPHTLAVHLLSDKYAGKTYDELIDLKKAGDSEFKDARNSMKRVNFGVLYQAGPWKISQELNCTPEEAEDKMNRAYFSHYKSLAKKREELARLFCTADFETWDRQSVAAMSDRVEGVFGDVRYICFERFLASYLWENANTIAAVAADDPRTIVRRSEKGPQTIQNCIRSSALGAASGIQKAVMRQLGNFPIQNAGARLTKKLMRRLWEKHHLPMMNVHDEIDIPRDVAADFDEVKETVDQFVKEQGEKIKHLSMEWKRTNTWADK